MRGKMCVWFMFPMFVMEVNRSKGWCAECLSADTLTMPTLHLRPDHSLLYTTPVRLVCLGNALHSGMLWYHRRIFLSISSIRMWLSTHFCTHMHTYVIVHCRTMGQMFLSLDTAGDRNEIAPVFLGGGGLREKKTNNSGFGISLCTWGWGFVPVARPWRKRYIL